MTYFDYFLYITGTCGIILLVYMAILFIVDIYTHIFNLPKNINILPGSILIGASCGKIYIDMCTKNFETVTYYPNEYETIAIAEALIDLYSEQYNISYKLVKENK